MTQPVELKDRFRYEAVLAANAFVTAYLFLHKAVVPFLARFLTERNAPEVQHQAFGFWWIFHLLIWGLLLKRTAGSFRWLRRLVWFGLGFIPLTIAHAFCTALEFSDRWARLAALITYGGSFVMLLSLLKFAVASEGVRKMFGVPTEEKSGARTHILGIAAGLFTALVWALSKHPSLWS